MSTNLPEGPRIFGLRHQEKETKGGEIRPTQLVRFDRTGKTVVIEFNDVREEIWWLACKYPTSWRAPFPEEDVTQVSSYVIFGKAPADVDLTKLHPSQVERGKKESRIALKIPAEWDGVRPSDTYLATSGGSGHQLNAGLSAKLVKMEGTGKVLVIPAIKLKQIYGVDRDRDQDAVRLIELFGREPNSFVEILKQDILIATVKSANSLRNASQLARTQHGNRLNKVNIMKAYAEPDLYAGAGLEVETLKEIAGDEDMVTLKGDESAATKALLAAVQATDIWQEILVDVVGIGPAIAGGLIAAIGDIRRFQTPWQLASYCGVGVVSKDKNGADRKYATIQRRRSGETSAWNNAARKSCWVFADQCNRRPDSIWGKHFLRIKAKLLKAHPKPIEVTKDLEAEVSAESPGKKKIVKRYTAGHIHRIAIWKLQTDFIWWLWREWKHLNAGKPIDFRPPGQRGKDIVNQDEATQVADHNPHPGRVEEVDEIAA